MTPLDIYSGDDEDDEDDEDEGELDDGEDLGPYAGLDDLDVDEDLDDARR